MSASPIICITPLSIDTAWSKRDDTVATRAGQIIQNNCGNKDPGTDFYFSIMCSWFFSIKNWYLI